MKVKWDSCFKIGVTIFVLYLCIHYWPAVGNMLSMVLGAASPLFIGCIIAYLVNILMSLYERHYFPKKKSRRLRSTSRPVCMVLAFLTLAAIVIIMILLVVPELISCVSVIFSAVPDALKSIVDFISGLEFVPDNIQAFLTSIDWDAKINQFGSILLSGMGNVMDMVVGTATSMFNGVVTGFLGLIFSIYLLLGKDTLGRQYKRLTERYLKPGWNRKINYILSILNDSFHKYVVGQCTEAVILGVLCMIGMLILQLPYATMIGALIAVTALIPVAGAYIGGVVGTLMIFSVSPIKAVIFVVDLVILQQVEGNLIYPKVVGSSLGLPAIWVLAAVTVGGGVMGIAGMLLGVPVASALYRILKDDLNRGTAKQQTVAKS
ncbi:MAG: AI-2E family transporter [Lachnospiraceae bacterium]|nr:AI-2E family transporter [Lachnospiraceae bacterium]